MQTTIIINKIDLLFDDKIQKLISLYTDIGYNVIPCSIISSEGIETIKNLTKGKINFFWGHSGVGKSSIINKIFPSLQLTVGEISKYSGKGKHTTVTVNMIPLEENTFIIDTPGVREIEPFGIRKEDLGHYFREFTDVINSCKFNTCTHFHEPGCAVESAVKNGLISELRYQSYLRMLNTIEDDIVF